MTAYQEQLMHQAKIVTLMGEKEITDFCNLNKIGVDALTNFFLKYIRCPRISECEFLSKYGFDKFSQICDAFSERPTLDEIHKVFIDSKFGNPFTSGNSK